MASNDIIHLVTGIGFFVFGCFTITQCAINWRLRNLIDRLDTALVTHMRENDRRLNRKD